MTEPAKDQEVTATPETYYAEHLRRCDQCARGPLCVEGRQLWADNGFHPAEMPASEIGSLAAKDDLISRRGGDVDNRIPEIREWVTRLDGKNVPYDELFDTSKTYLLHLLGHSDDVESFRRGVVERLREVATGYQRSSDMVSNTAPQLRFTRAEIAKLLNALADEFAAADSGEMRTTATSLPTDRVSQDIKAVVAEIRERRAKITPGPWGYDLNGYVAHIEDDREWGRTIAKLLMRTKQADIDGEFIANAPTDIDTLLQIIDSLTVDQSHLQLDADHTCDGVFGGSLGYNFNKPCSVCGQYKDNTI